MSILLKKANNEFICNEFLKTKMCVYIGRQSFYYKVDIVSIRSGFYE